MPPLNWHKTMPQGQRIQAALRARHGNALAAARSLNVLSNLTYDPETKYRARLDATKLFQMARLAKAQR